MPERTLQIDSRVLDKAEAREEAPEIGMETTEVAEEEQNNGQPAAKVSKKDLLGRNAFLASGKVAITPPLFNQEPLRRRVVLTLNMNKIVQPGRHIENVKGQPDTASRSPA